VRSGAGQKPLWEVFALLCVYLASMWFGIRRLARDWSPTAFTRVLLVALISSLATDWLGVHALFGAFMAGVVMPKRQEFTDLVARKIEPLTVELLLPLFFVLTGLRTRIGLVQGWSMWVTCVAIIAIAVLGKWGGGMLAARWNGMSWRDASALGILMNTRGLVELVILNIGLDLGILSPALFSMMVIMALVTTFMTSPLLQLSLRNRGEHGRSAFSGR
jgi:Kef-type K+ transport system membrane component KefB